MNKQDIYEYWSKQKNSRHRSNENSFIARKASEHIKIIRSLPNSVEDIVDIGSGFGEILEHYLIAQLPVKVAQDFNINALQSSKERCAYLTNHRCIFSDLSIEEILSIYKCDTIIASASINQYCDMSELRQFFQTAASSKTIQQIVFFDCIDPLLYLVCFPYSSFQKKDLNRSVLNALSQFKCMLLKTIKYLHIVIKKILFTSSDAIYLGKAGMGFGYFPFDMQFLANKYGFDIRVQSSIYYEYRYHCVFTKRP